MSVCVPGWADRLGVGQGLVLFEGQALGHVGGHLGGVHVVGVLVHALVHAAVPCVAAGDRAGGGQEGGEEEKLHLGRVGIVNRSRKE